MRSALFALISLLFGACLFSRAAAVPQERSVFFDSEGLRFPAILTLPVAAKCPLVVMLSGSGPQDADESIGPNRPFRDLAQSLAEQGIASLRYPKRSKLAPKTMSGEHMDLNWEYVQDAVAALAYASTLAEVDPARIYVMGHSLGGSIAPRVVAVRLAQAPGSVAGIVLLAPGVVPIDETIRRQVLTQQQLAGATPAQLDEVRGDLDAMFAKILRASTPPDEIVGMGALQLPERYWREWLKVAPADSLRRLSIPSLVLRGAADIQVSHQDVTLLVPAQYGERSQHVEIPNLDHFFFSVTGQSTGKEYLKENQVAPVVGQTIAKWINQG